MKKHLRYSGAAEKELMSLMRDNARSRRVSQVFSDFCELSSLAISNSVDPTQFDKREARYLQIVGQYERAEIKRFPQMLAVLVEWMEEGIRDCLGQLFMSLELGDARMGQFFTPFEVSCLMARMLMGDARERIERDGFIDLMEPACGAGGMVIASADALQEQGINYQQAMCVRAIDIDQTAVHMTYLQLSLLHIPALVVHGNALSAEVRSQWVTPAYVMGFWDHKLWRRSKAAKDAGAVHEVPTMPEPLAKEVPPTAEPALGTRERAESERAVVIQEFVAQLGLFE